MRTAIGPEGIAVDPAVFTALCAKSHRVVSRADLLLGGETVRSGLKVVSGSVTSNRRTAQRSRCTVSIAEADLLPTLPDGRLRPDGHEIRLWLGVNVPAVVPYATFTDYLTGGGDYLTGGGEFLVIGEERTAFGEDIPSRDLLVPLGVFRIQGGEVDAGNVVTRIEGADRSWPVSYARLEDAVAWDPSMTLEDAVLDLLFNAIGTDVPVDVTGGHACPTVVHERGADPWEIILKAAAAVGYIPYFDGDGRFVWEPDPVLLGGDPVATVSDGEGGALVSLTVKQSAGPTFNRVVAVSSNPDITTTYVGVATDTDPNSPTRYGGDFGKKPRFYESPFITNQDNANSAANSIMRDAVGLVRSFQLTMVPNPLLEPGDTVHVSESTLQIDEPLVFDEVTVGLGAEDVMSVAVHAPASIEEAA